MKKKFIKIALQEAKKGFENEEIPVGCVIVKNDIIISSSHNKREASKDAIMHAEIIAIEEACHKLGSWRLDECELYVTLEPCMMCMGAIIESRIKKVYFGTKNNSEQMYDFGKISKYVDIYNLKDSESSKILSDFFKKKRKK